MATKKKTSSDEAEVSVVDESKAATIAALQSIPEDKRTDEENENLTNLLAA